MINNRVEDMLDQLVIFGSKSHIEIRSKKKWNCND